MDPHTRILLHEIKPGRSTNMCESTQWLSCWKFLRERFKSDPFNTYWLVPMPPTPTDEWLVLLLLLLVHDEFFLSCQHEAFIVYFFVNTFCLFFPIQPAVGNLNFASNSKYRSKYVW